MDELRILCKCCHTEVVKSGSCGCPNMATIRGDRISAFDMSQIVLVSGINTKKNNRVFSPLELAEQDARRKRKVRKLDFEVK